MSREPEERSPARFEVHIVETQESFECARDQEILKAMVQLGRRGIPSGCHGGGCGVCKIKVLEGQVRAQMMSRDHVTQEEESAGYVLACRAAPLTPLKIEVVGSMNKVIARRYGFI